MDTHICSYQAMSCNLCKSKFSSRAQVISCDGYCGDQFHSSCCDLPSDALKLLDKRNGLSWFCQKCRVVTKSLNPEVFKEIFELKFASIVNQFDDLLVNVRSEITRLASAKLDEVCSSIKSELSCMAKTADNSAMPLSNAGKACNTLYSTALKSKSAVIIKPKDPNQKNAATKSEILQKINPVEEGINISSVKNIKDGGVVIGCSGDRDVQVLKELATTKLTSKYDIKDVPGLLPRIRLVGMSDKFDEKTLIDFIRKQNKLIFDDSSKCSVLKIWPVKNKRNNDLYQSVLQVDVLTYNRIMSDGRGKLFVGLDSCHVHDWVNLQRCYNCNGYNHVSDRCSDRLSCPRCANEHTLKDCKCTSNDFKCINCVKHLEKYPGSNIDVKHSVWDPRCFVYCRGVDERKSNFYVA